MNGNDKGGPLGFGLLKSKDDKNDQRPRGKICKLCDRKFLIHQQMSGSFKIIDAQNLSIKNIQQQNEKFIESMEADKRE